jgi:Flp pilus assembly protein TadD
LPLRIETSATAHFNLGVAYAAQANDADEPDAWLELAENELREALADEKRYASVPTELGKVLARRGHNEEAVRAYEQALQIEPGNYRTHHALGLLRTRLGDLGGASTSFRRALELEPRHVASAVRLGDTLLELGRPSRAIEAFRHALALAPDNARAVEGLRAAEGKARDK